MCNGLRFTIISPLQAAANEVKDDMGFMAYRARLFSEECVLRGLRLKL